LKYPIAMALVKNELDLNANDAITIDIRGRRVTAEVVKLPFYKRQK